MKAHLAFKVIFLTLALVLSGVSAQGQAGTISGFVRDSTNSAVLQAVGLDKVMVETDSPYLAPVPKRGRTNEPAYVRHVARRIAEILDMALEEVAEITTANAAGLFPALKTIPTDAAA